MPIPAGSNEAAKVHPEPEELQRWLTGWDLLMFLASVGVLLACIFYLRSFAATPHYSGLTLDPSSWEVLSAPKCGAGEPCLRPGDKVVSIGSLTLPDYRSDWNRPLFESTRPDGSVEITARRAGKSVEVTLQQTARSLLLVVPAWMISLLFWCVGTLVTLLARPRNLSWVILILLFQSTALWLSSGLVSRFHIAGAMHVYHGIVWFFLPLLVHVHLRIPYPIWPRFSRLVLPILYMAAVLLVVLDFTGRLPNRLAALWAGTAALAALLLIGLRLLSRRGPPEKMADRILFLGVVIGLLPMAFFAFLPLLRDAEVRRFVTVIAGGLLGLCLPVWPLSYIYALSKSSRGMIELRANRLIGGYGFFCLFVTAFVTFYVVGDYWLPTEVSRVPFTLLLALAFVIGAPPARRTFQRFVDGRIYGIKYLPEEIVGVFAARIPRASDIVNLRRLLLDEVLPTLMIRESALYVRNDDDQIEEVYREGDPRPPRSRDAELRGWMNLSSESSALLTRPDWVRHAVPLKGRERALGVWLLGRRDPDDLYPAADRELLKSIANQIAPVVENIRLVERAQREVEENRKLQQQLIQSQKMEAIGRLSAGVAHDFNNLLSVILGYSSLLLVQYKWRRTLTGYLDDIRDAGDRAAALTRQLLAFSRQQVMEARAVHLNHVVIDVERMLQRLAGEDVEVRTELGEDLPKVRIDPRRWARW